MDHRTLLKETWKQMAGAFLGYLSNGELRNICHFSPIHLFCLPVTPTTHHSPNASLSSALRHKENAQALAIPGYHSCHNNTCDNEKVKHQSPLHAHKYAIIDSNADIVLEHLTNSQSSDKHF
jgi:hypothetical protein